MSPQVYRAGNPPPLGRFYKLIAAIYPAMALRRVFLHGAVGADIHLIRLVPDPVRLRHREGRYRETEMRIRQLLAEKGG